VIVNLLVDAIADDAELLGDDEREELQFVNEILARARMAIAGLGVEDMGKVTDLDTKRSKK
jgi:hypothetical protein